MGEKPMSMKPEYIGNICLFNKNHPVKITVFEKRFGQVQELEIRKKLPKELHEALVQFATDAVAE